MTLDECELLFENISASSNKADFVQAVQPLFDFYQLLTVDVGRGKILWRARIIEDSVYSNISELDYPPSHLAGLGRLNDLGSPCLYVASREETAIAEVNAMEGQLVQIAGFRISPEKNIRLALIGEYSNIHKCGYMHFGGVDPGQAINRYLNSMPRADAFRLIFVDKFFSHLLADPAASERDYILSRSLASVIHEKSKSAAGIVFPSVKDKGGVNIGIQPESSIGFLHNTCCFIAKVLKRRAYGMIEYEVLESAKFLNPDGSFVWGGSSAPDSIGIYGITKNEFDFARNDNDKRNALLNLTRFSGR